MSKNKLKQELKQILINLHLIKFTSDDFLKLFIATMFQKNAIYFNRIEFIEKISEYKEKNKFSQLLNGIKFENDGVSSDSKQLRQSITEMKILDLLYTDEFDSKEILYINEKIVNEPILLQYSSFISEMEKLVREYNRTILETAKFPIKKLKLNGKVDYE